MADTLKLTVDDMLTGRIDKVLAHQFSQFSRSHLQKWIEDGNVRVNGQTVKPKYKLAVGDQVVIEPEAPQKMMMSSS